MSKIKLTKHLVKEHIKLWQECAKSQPHGASEELRALLRKAQESQKSCQKIMKQHELEAHVQGWNPWTVMKFMFPAKNGDKGKKRSSTSNNMRKSHNPRQWKKLMRVADTLDQAYNNMD
ncbi:hypothetical protein PTTG_05765 [Puccinia triticina 1-1 BBBD Race 1]|uniref:Uncharacterized protein n=1 Tax=Puccinia triticina (isolate 1-1 / race 1 (BBBD)) TaxID=630390 RepID=A0A0C4EY66_PUCT1|nr:hypothetical protein PTTG_05765 [Puccinia triticina 1-1 BBBD Race 1]